ncbi:MAG: cupin-like domain-containing protein [Myxococcales bacterium]|nr:MAG: cupin-like domain-containing protein [Myxococcales bacterium]
MVKLQEISELEAKLRSYSPQEETERKLNISFLANHLLRYPDFLTKRRDELVREGLKRLKDTAIAPEEEVPRVHYSEIDPEEFERLMWESPHPIIVEGLLERFAAIKKWSPDFFDKHYGDIAVPANPPGGAAYPGYSIPMKRLVEEMKTGSHKETNYHYVSNWADVFNDNPELKSDLPLEELSEFVGVENLGAQLFMGAGSRGTNFHCANVINFFCQIWGEKTWWFVHPKHSSYMEPLKSHPDMLYVSSMIGFQSTPLRTLDTGEMALANYVPRLKAHIKPGEILFIPAWWWHAVQNTSDSSCGVATRYAPFRLRYTRKTNPLFNLLTWTSSYQYRSIYQWNVKRQLRDRDVHQRFHLIGRAFRDAHAQLDPGDKSGT